MAALREWLLQLGFRFNPTPQEAVTYTLPRLIAGEPMHPAVRSYIHDTDIYACEPGFLAAQFQPTPRTGDRFFVTTCKRQPQKAGKSSRAVRAAGPGSWHSQGNTTDVKDGAGVKVGEVKKLRYKKGGAFTDWLMDEFSCCSKDADVGDRQRVLCKIYVSPRAAPDSAARQAAAAAFAPPPPDEPVAATNRPAQPVAEQPCPKRPRCAVVPTPPPCAPRHGMAPASTRRLDPLLRLWLQRSPRLVQSRLRRWRKQRARRLLRAIPSSRSPLPRLKMTATSTWLIYWKAPWR